MSDASPLSPPVFLETAFCRPCAAAGRGRKRPTFPIAAFSQDAAKFRRRTQTVVLNTIVFPFPLDRLWETSKVATGMNRKVNAMRRCSQMKAVLPQNGRLSEFFYQVAHPRTQRSGNFHKRIHRGRFFPALDTANKNRGKIGFFGQLFLRETGFLPFDTNCFPQKAAVLLAGRHESLKDAKRRKISMSLTTTFTCIGFDVVIRTVNLQAKRIPKTDFQKVNYENI